MYTFRANGLRRWALIYSAVPAGGMGWWLQDDDGTTYSQSDAPHLRIQECRDFRALSLLTELGYGWSHHHERIPPSLFAKELKNGGRW